MKQNRKSQIIKTRYYSDEIVKKLSSLGCAFNVKSPSVSTDPENCIIESLRFYWEYNDIFFMIYSLLENRISHLIHIERLANLAEKAYIKSDEKVLLIALCNKLAEKGDHRFKLISKKLHKKGLKMHNPPRNECSAHLIKLWGAETSLLPFGVKVRSFYKVNEKKLFSLKEIYKKNIWLKLRAIIGPNYRSDILYLKSTGIAKTAYQAAKIAGCNTSTATRIWKSVEYIPDLKKLIA